MKKSALTAFIKEEILSTLGEDAQTQQDIKDTEELTQAMANLAKAKKEAGLSEEFSEFKTYDDIIGGLIIRADAMKKYLSQNEPDLLPLADQLKAIITDLDNKISDIDFWKLKEEEDLNEAREYDADAMEALGFDLYPGGRSEAFRYATEELGVPADEILGKISDDVIYNAIHHSLQVMDMYPIDEKVNEEEDAPAGDAEVEKKASKQDEIIKDFKRISAQMKTHLELYKTSESPKNKETAKQMLKKLTPEYQAAKEKYEKLKSVKV